MPAGVRRKLAKEIAREDVPTWAYRLGIAMLFTAFGGLSLWWLQDIVGKVNELGKDVVEIRRDQAVQKGDTSSIKTDIQRIGRDQEKQQEKFDRFERDTRRDFQRIEEKLEKKQDKR